jgi:hypothetical protein
MKNRSSKTILVFFALGLISCALCVQQAQAVPITGAITFAGGVEMNGTADTATQVTGWLDQSGFMPTVQSVSGSFAAIGVGDTAMFQAGWFFNSGPIAVFWTVDGFTFSLIASHIVSQGGGFLNVSGTGTITGPGFDATAGTWNFSIQDDGAGGVFSWSGSGQSLPDGGATVALLGLALAGIEGIRRKLRRAKS